MVHIYLLAAFTYLRVGFLMYCFILLFARAYVFTRREFLFCSFRKSLYFYTLLNLRDFLASQYLSSKENTHTLVQKSLDVIYQSSVHNFFQIRLGCFTVQWVAN